MQGGLPFPTNEYLGLTFFKERLSDKEIGVCIKTTYYQRVIHFIIIIIIIINRLRFNYVYVLSIVSQGCLQLKEKNTNARHERFISKSLHRTFKDEIHLLFLILKDTYAHRRKCRNYFSNI